MLKKRNASPGNGWGRYSGSCIATVNIESSRSAFLAKQQKLVNILSKSREGEGWFAVFLNLLSRAPLQAVYHELHIYEKGRT